MASPSAGYRAVTDRGVAHRLRTADPEALEVLRFYATILDRQPDAGSLTTWN